MMILESNDYVYAYCDVCGSLSFYYNEHLPFMGLIYTDGNFDYCSECLHEHLKDKFPYLKEQIENEGLCENQEVIQYLENQFRLGYADMYETELRR